MFYKPVLTIKSLCSVVHQRGSSSLHAKALSGERMSRIVIRQEIH